MSWQHRIVFIRGFLNRPGAVGAIAPSSQAAAAALCKPYREFRERSRRPVAVLEVGAGTGPITRRLGTLLGPEDTLDVYEIDEALASVLQRDVLGRSEFERPIQEGRVRLFREPIQNNTQVSHYDFVIAGLPFTSFELVLVKDILRVIRRSMKPDAVLSYFEYIVLRQLNKALATGRNRRRAWTVSRYLSHNLRKYQFEQNLVFNNLPPCVVHHLRFQRRSAEVGRVALAALQQLSGG